MNVTYGIDVQESDDPYIALAEEALSGINEAAIPGAFWIDLFPILKHVPSWLPGAGFQKKAALWREVNTATIEKPFRYVEVEQLVGEYFLIAHDRPCLAYILCDNSAEECECCVICSSSPH